MLGTEGFVDIQVLHRQGMSIKSIAQQSQPYCAQRINPAATRFADIGDLRCD
jgi:hypothetical protein